METDDKDIFKILPVMAVAAAPYLFWLPVWIIGWCLLSWGYVFWVTSSGRPKPKTWLRQVLVVVGLLGVLISFEWELKVETFVGMLAIMASLKPMEIRSYRDKMVTLFLTCFLILTNLLFNNSLPIVIYLFTSVCLTIAALIAVNCHGVPVASHMRLAALMTIQALPLTVALFFLFPRAHGYFWGSLRQEAAQSGFSERLSPGDATYLAQNDSIAFRADFHGEIPPRKFLYWRGMVYWFFDGGAWERGEGVPRRRSILSGEKTVRYTISLEPHGKKWWFALDLPVYAARYVRFFDDFTLASRRNVTDLIIYTLRSHTVYHTGPMNPFDNAALELPESGNPKARALAEKWSSQTRSAEEIVSKALLFLKENGFAYTLRPTKATGDAIDDFLFRTRKGYCEHFASAFAFLMRAAGIPARIVGGYLGGERNPFGNYLIIRQSDAHVWVEVWLPKTGWSRIDPTSTVAPQRIVQGAAAALPPAERPRYLSSPYWAALYRYWKPVQFAWDRANNSWNLWVVGYSNWQQRQLFSNVGIKGGRLKTITAALAIILASAGLSIALAQLVRGRILSEETDPVQKAYLLFCRKLSRTIMPKAPGQGPVDYARRITARRKDLAAGVQEITALYVQLRYGRAGSKRDVERLQRLVRKFKPKKTGRLLPVNR